VTAAWPTQTVSVDGVTVSVAARLANHLRTAPSPPPAAISAPVSRCAFRVLKRGQPIKPICTENAAAN
jgi:hypothetical protein